MNAYQIEADLRARLRRVQGPTYASHRVAYIVQQDGTLRFIVSRSTQRRWNRGCPHTEDRLLVQAMRLARRYRTTVELRGADGMLLQRVSI